MSICIIDIGSNSSRASVYEQAGQCVPPIFEGRVRTGLGAFITANNTLSAEGIALAAESVQQLLAEKEVAAAGEVHILAMAALRNIANSAEALSAISEQLHHPVTVLSGKQEARLGFESLLAHTHATSGVCVDVGGGSTEVTCFSAAEMTASTSVALGTLKLQKAYGAARPVTPEMAKQAAAAIDTALRAHALPLEQQQGCCLFGLGGTSYAAAALLCHKQQREVVPHIRFAFSALEELALALEQNDDAAWAAVDELAAPRANSIYYGLTLFVEIGRACKATEFCWGSASARDGYLLSL